MLFRRDSLKYIVELFGIKRIQHEDRYMEEISLSLSNPVEFDSMPNLKAIYIFDNPLRALASQKRRGWRWYYTNYLKLKNSKLGLYSDQKMLSAMVRQFEAWNSFNSKSLPICSITFDQLFDASNKKLSNFIGIDCSDFPPIVERSSTKINMHLPKNLKASVDDIISLL